MYQQTLYYFGSAHSFDYDPTFWDPEKSPLMAGAGTTLVYSFLLPNDVHLESSGGILYWRYDGDDRHWRYTDGLEYDRESDRPDRVFLTIPGRKREEVPIISITEFQYDVFSRYYDE